MEDLQYEEEPARRFAGLMLRDPLPGESTIQHFRHPHPSVNELLVIAHTIAFSVH